jgi:hypothetical protein
MTSIRESKMLTRGHVTLIVSDSHSPARQWFVIGAVNCLRTKFPELNYNGLQ